ncbi:hypothetical protein [Kitasatospora paranensis]|uniref:Gram-positive cocci surface proteins LPxTG domain-containing protein n=1 Tax=Kitasatospora paranensis TaxID=258053 RepID=A0ABW2FSK0_9ACTN
MASVIRMSAGRAVAAGGALVAVAVFAVPAYAGGSSSGAATPIKGRTEGGSLELVNGDVVACAGVGDLRVVGADGEHRTDGPGTTFTTAAGTAVATVKTGTVKVTVRGADAVITCGSELFPTTTATVPTGPSLAGGGGGVSGADTAVTLAGGAIAMAGLVGGTAVVLRRRPGRAEA